MSEFYDVYCKMPEDKRGEYTEVIYVEVPRRSAHLAKKKAQEIIDSGIYMKELRPSTVLWRPLG